MPKKDKNRKNYQDGGDVNPLFTVKGADLADWDSLSPGDPLKRRSEVAASKYANLVQANPSAYGFDSWDAAKDSWTETYGSLANAAEGFAKDIYTKGEFGVRGGDLTNLSNIETVNLGGQNLTSYDDSGSVVGGTTLTSQGVTTADNAALRGAFSGAEFGGVSAEKKIVHYVIYNPEGTSTKYYTKEVYEGDPKPAGYVAGPFPDADSATAALNALVEQAKANEGSGEGGGTGNNTVTGETGGPLETRFGDVLNQMDHLAGLSGKTPDLLPTSKVSAQDIKVKNEELETTGGVLVGSDPTALTSIISNEQIEALQAAGYTLKSDADTVSATTDTHAKVTNQAFNAQTLNALSDTVTAQDDTPTVGESIIAQAPSTETIGVKKAEGLTADEVASVSRRNEPAVEDFSGTYNQQAQYAQRSMEVGDTVPEIDPLTAHQGPAQVMTELRDNAVMQLAQTSEDEQIRATAQAMTQQMSDVPVEATVQGQLVNLMAQFADGKIPPYAAGAIRNANAQMAARGLSASSMAGAAIMQAAMESSLPIAAQDAQVFREINLTNLNNKQQVALANAAAGLQISLADLNNRQQRNLQNSTNAFSLQTQSLSNMQQASLANAQLRAALQERELNFEQQRAITNAARYSEIENINLSNEQQAKMQDSVNNIQFAMSNLSFQQQRRLSKAQIDAALTGQELTNDQQRAVINAARIAEVNNLKFTEEQQRNLAESQIMQSLSLADLDAEMKTAITNAATYANMDMANLNNRQQAEVLNAQSFLQLDLQGLSNKQQGEVLKYQSKTQALFNDAAADNARKQFNAQSENQVDQFFAQLGAQVAQQNAQRVAAMKQFNVDQENSQARFNANLTDTRDKFNSTMTAQINQSNAAWRRQVNTVNTATQNEANRVNALNNFAMSQQALNNLWQQYRDESSWLFTQGLTREQFGHELVKLSMQGDINTRLFNHKYKTGVWESIGGAAMRWLADAMDEGETNDQPS